MEQQTLVVKGEWIALCDVLKVCGVTDSGGRAKALVASGVVQVDGQIELRKTCKIRPGQCVSGEGYAIRIEAQA